VTPAKKKAEDTPADEQLPSVQAQFSEYKVVQVEKTDGPPLGVQVEQHLGVPRED
jgi:hypothetical protein